MFALRGEKTMRLCLKARLLISAALIVSMLPAVAFGQGMVSAIDHPLASDVAGDGTIGAAARRAMSEGSLPGPFDAAAKFAANAAASGLSLGAGRSSSDNSTGIAAAARRAPTVIGGHSFAGQNLASASSPQTSPPSATGAIGTTRYVQLVNRRFGIYNRNTHALVAGGTLNTLFGTTANNFNPQIIWDPTTNRFYYSGNMTVSATDNRIAHGFSKSASPSNGSTDWCHYSTTFNSLFPDSPKLGDTSSFYLVGVNIYSGSTYSRADLLAYRKPTGTGTIATCPSISRFTKTNLTGTAGFAPVPANQVDTDSVGYVLARNITPSTNRLWLYRISQTGSPPTPVFSTGRQLTLPFSVATPSDATQEGGLNRLDTGDTRPTQAILARNDKRSNAFSLWTQQTVADGSQSAVRFYEIEPVANPPTLRRNGSVGVGSGTPCYYFNAAVSPDRRVDGATSVFGGSVVLQYNVSGSASGCDLNPRIVAGSSLNGAGFTFLTVKTGVDEYADFTCTPCRWGDVSGASPDPRPGTSGAGGVWITNQYSGVVNPNIAAADWRTWISAIKP